MPRRSSGPKLWFDRKRDTFTIVDGRSRHRTGFGPTEIGGAEGALREYIEKKHEPAKSPTPFLADIIATYAEEHVKHLVSGKHIAYDLRNLAKWWGTKRISDISSSSCKAYIAHRDAGACSRRELSFLNAAMQHWKTNHAPTIALPKIKLPPKPEPRQDFMTRKQAARFLRLARRTPHLARFFLIGWYTGSRRGAICGIKWSMVDLETGVMRRKPRHVVETKKKAPTIRVGDRLLAHLRRWKRMDGDKPEYIVNFRGKKISRPDKSWTRIWRLGRFPDYVTPHVLRHSRATYMLKAGVPLWETAKYLGMSPAVLEKHYGHHMPDWQKNAANAR
ncbi:site-specific integrase [Bradyrhizobium genosp. L]|uniref:tyrosine-type recombinase/integrase n=1 Tax=Bradyrhizobium genosp. L TaxID=83637 RepID=UPI0018A2687B|nr:site-specific integrase [Bradyrhizobium genosp. L]QPF86978.1 site-specific integrase [Bradyrhizobium genosp. L]